MVKHTHFILGVISVTGLLFSGVGATALPTALPTLPISIEDLLNLSILDPLFKEIANSLGISIDPNDVGFYLYPNSGNLFDADRLIYNNSASVSNSRYNKNLPVIFMTHGFTQTYLSQYPYYVKKAYLNANYPAKANIIAVDWGKLSGQVDSSNVLVEDITELPAYVVARKNVEIVGQRISDFLRFLLKDGVFLSNANQIRLEGQSLGAQASGMAGLYFSQATGTKVARITGTEPAGPLFDGCPINKRLDPTDATFVDVYHTNAGGFGYLGNVGTIDYYINGGTFQKACSSNVTDLFCSHNLAPRYFALSIGDPTLQACSSALSGLNTPCLLGTEVTFGEQVPSGTKGTYYINLDTFQQ